MPLQILDFLRAPLIRPKVNQQDVFASVIDAYNQPKNLAFQRAQEGQKLKMGEQDILGKQLENQLTQQYGGSQEQAKLALLQAQAGRQGRMGQGGIGGSGALSNIGKLLNEREQAIQNYGPDSPQVQAIDGYINRLSQGRMGANSGVTSPVKTRQLNAMIANKARTYIAENLEMPYIGSGSIVDLRKDVLEYKKTKDPKRKEELANKLAKASNAIKLEPEYASLQLLGQGVNPTVSALTHQKKAIQLGWPETIRLETENFPKEIQQKANRLHSESLRKISEIREKAYKEALLSGEGNLGEFRSSNGSDMGGSDYSIEDIENTAALKGISVEEVKKILGIE